MSEEQALNDDVVDEVDTGETVDTDETIEQEAAPASEQVPIGVQRRFKKLTAKVNEGTEESASLRQEIELRDEQIKLLQAGSKVQAKRPDEDDFDSPAEFKAAEDAWIDQRIAAKAGEVAAKEVQAFQSRQAAASSEQAFYGKLETHYGRGQAIPGYEAIEDKAVGIIGNDMAKLIMSTSSRSEAIMVELGNNPVLAEEIRELAKTNPTAAFVKALEVKPKKALGKTTIAPDPDEPVSGGSGGISAIDRKLDKARENAARTGDMSELMALKRQARA